MFYDSDQTLEALYATERTRRQPPVQSNGKSLLTGLVVGILIGKRLGK